MSNYLTNSEITAMAEAVLSAHEVTPLSHTRKCEIAAETAADEFGKTARRSAVLLAVKLANMGWNEIVLRRIREVA